MDLFPTPEQALLADAARDFAARAFDADAVSVVEATDIGFDTAHWQTMSELGWTTLPPLELALVVEQLGRRAVPSPLVITASLRNALPDLDARLERDDAVATLAALVPGARDEWDGPHPHVASTISGASLLVPYAASADVIVAATADGLVTVDPAADGTRARRETTVGGDALFRVYFDEAGAKPIDGDLGTVLDHLGVAGLAYAVGAAEGALALAVEHAKGREQFGRPIGSFQAVAHRCADMRAEIDACRLLVYRAAWALADDGDRLDDAELAVSSALGYSKDALRRVAMHAHQVHGAIGFSTEHDLHLFTRRIKAFELTAGSTARHQERFASAIGLRGDNSGNRLRGASDGEDDAQA
jgi:alkylation response protein AidB-like acyl-CoA dehydrogenase